MTNMDSERACSLSGIEQGAMDPLRTTALPLAAGPTELDQPVPISLSDLPTIATKIDLDQTLPMEPVVLAQLCAQTQVSARRRVLPHNLEYSVHVLVEPEAMVQAAANAAPRPGPPELGRVPGLQLLALLLGPLLGLLLGAGAAWQLTRPSKRIHGLRAGAAYGQDRPQAPRRELPLHLEAQPVPREPRNQPQATEAARPGPSPSVAGIVPPSRQAAVAPSVSASTAPSGSQPGSSHAEPAAPTASGAAAAPQGRARNDAAVASSAPEVGRAHGLPAAATLAAKSDRQTPALGAKPAAKTTTPPPSGLEKLISELRWAEPAPPVSLADNLRASPEATRFVAHAGPEATRTKLPAASADSARPDHELAPDQPAPLGETSAQLEPGRPDKPAPPRKSEPAEAAPLKYLSGEKPKLPLLVRRLYGHQPVVGTYRVCVHPSGSVAAVTAIAGIPFDDEIQKTLRSWRFAPRALAACVDQELHFEVDE